MAIRLIHVGLGGFGQDWEYRRIPPVKEVQPVAFVDSDPGSMERAQQRLGLSPDDCFSELHQAVEARDADAVLITAPVEGHAPLAIEAMGAGLHVLTEKPFAASIAAAREAVDVAAATDRVLMVSQNYRFQPAARTAARLVAEQAVGRPGAVRVDFRKWANDAERGGHKHYELVHPLLYDMSIHHFDLMRYVLGEEAKTVHVTVTDPPWSKFTEPASATLTVTFESGVVVSYRGSWVSSGEPTTWSGDWHVECEDGEIYWTGRSGQDDAPYEAVEVRRRGAGVETPPLVEMEQLGRSGVLTAFAEAIESGVEPETSGRRNLGTLALMEAAGRSAASGQLERVDV